MDVTYVTYSTSLPAKTSPVITIGLLASILWLQMNYYFKKTHSTNKSKIHLVTVIRKRDIFPFTD